MFTSISWNVSKKEEPGVTVNLLMVGLVPENLAHIRAGEPALLSSVTHATPPGWEITILTRTDAEKLMRMSGHEPTKRPGPLVGAAQTPNGYLYVMGLTSQQLDTLGNGGLVVFKDDKHCSPPGWEICLVGTSSELDMARNLEAGGWITDKTKSRIDPRLFGN